MFNKPLAEVTFDDVVYLVRDLQISEGYNLDYKKDIDRGNIDKAKTSLAKDVSSFANSSGGYLIFGISDNKEILGIDNIVNNRSISEWVNQIISTNIDPLVYYEDPKVIDIPDKEKVLLILHILESNSKPHMVNSESVYYLRVNDSSKKANHGQVRDMFDLSRNKYDNLERYLKKRKLSDEDMDSLGFTKNYRFIDPQLKSAAAIYSFIPVNVSEEKIKLSIQELHQWLINSQYGFPPHERDSVFTFYNGYEVETDSINYYYPSLGQCDSCIEIANNGYIENISISKNKFYVNHTTRGDTEYLADASHIVQKYWQLLGFYRKLAQKFEINDEIIIQVAFVNVMHYSLFEFHPRYDIHYYRGARPRNNKHNKILFKRRLILRNISDDEIKQEVIVFADKLYRSFGFDQNYSFFDDEFIRARG